MKKTLFALLTLALLLCVGAACADTVTLGAIYATCEIPDTYILLRADNLSRHPEWLSRHNTSEEEMLADWEARGVLLQAWTQDGDACLEITAVRDEGAVAWHDIDDQTPNLRATYRRDHLSGSKYKSIGYNIQSAEWKKTAEGRFLMLKYKRTWEGTTWRGYARKTIKNGYTITLDYKVFGRGLANKDNNSLNKVWNSWKFTQHITRDQVSAPAGTGVAGSVTGGISTGDLQGDGSTEAAPAPATTAHLSFTAVPPDETNTGKFTVEGSCDPNTHLAGVCMSYGGGDPVIFETDADRRGRFKLSVQLPQEGIWLMTMNAVQNGQIVEEYVLNSTTYQHTLLTVSFTNPLPAEMELTGDSLVISGVTMKQTTVQCLVDGRYNKQIRTNNSGKFSFKIDTTADGVYSISLTFSKKSYDTRRFTCTATRATSTVDIREKALNEAIKPAYTLLSKKVSAYVGRIMTYQMYVTETVSTGDAWLIFMAQRLTAGGYSDLVVVTASEDPGFEPGSIHRMYGTLRGTYLVQDSVNGDQYYPCFELIFWDE